MSSYTSTKRNLCLRRSLDSFTSEDLPKRSNEYLLSWYRCHYAISYIADNGIEGLCPQHLLYCGLRWEQCWKSRGFFVLSFILRRSYSRIYYKYSVPSRMEKKRRITTTEDASTAEPRTRRFIMLSSRTDCL